MLSTMLNFKSYKKRCPKYDFFKGSLLHLFYQDLNEYEKRLLDSSARSAFIDLSHDVAAGCAKFVFSYKQCDLGQLIAKRAVNELQYNSKVIYFFVYNIYTIFAYNVIICVIVVLNIVNINKNVSVITVIIYKTFNLFIMLISLKTVVFH